jgi:hypothetical protein
MLKDVVEDESMYVGFCLAGIKKVVYFTEINVPLHGKMNKTISLLYMVALTDLISCGGRNTPSNVEAIFIVQAYIINHSVSFF